MGVACSNRKENEPILLHADVYIWKEKQKKSHLYDYANQEQQHQQIPLPHDARLCKMGEDVLPVLPNQSIVGATDLFVIRDRVLKPITEVWSIIRNEPVYNIPVLNRVQLFPGNTIRLGRVKILLWEACFNQAQATEESEKDRDEELMDEKEENNQEFACRICMSKTGTLHNPLINPCQCKKTVNLGSGSVKYIHIKCLQQWIHNKFKIKELNNIVLYFWTRLNCEICKEQYKMEYRYFDRKYHLIDIPRPKEAYIIFQICHIDKNKEQGLYVISLNGRNNIKIGRVQENDIKLQDISVSRNHATITFNKEEQTIFIEDMGSKFGTLLQIDELKIEGKQIIQVANSLITFNIMKKSVKHTDIPSNYKVIEKEIEIPEQEYVEDEVVVNEKQYLSDEEMVS